MELTNTEAHDLVGAYVLDALDEDDRAAFESWLDDDPALARATGDLLEAASLLGAAEADAPPADLAERTFAAAFARRPPGTPSAAMLPDPATVYRAQMAELTELLAELRADDWQAATVTGWTAHELLAHLLAIESYTGTILGLAPPSPELAIEIPEGTENDHLRMTDPAVVAWSSGPPEATVAAWQALVDANVAHLATLEPARMDDRISFHGLDLSMRSFLGVRTFEAWTHTEDIRRALGRPSVAPEPGRLAFMSSLAVNALPLGLLLTGIEDTGRTVRVVLTGAGGGEWIQPLTVGAEPGEPTATLIADVVDFCRLAAQRLTPEELPYQADGDAEVIRDVLIGAQVFAA